MKTTCVLGIKTNARDEFNHFLLAIKRIIINEFEKWWSEFWKDNAIETNWRYRIWNNQGNKNN